MEFQPFEVRLSAPADDAGARVTARALGREADGLLRLSAAERREIAAWFDDAVQRSPAAQRNTAEDVGARLFTALLDAAPLRLWHEARATSAALELRLSWQPGDAGVAELAALPWELLYDTERHVFVAVDGRTSIVRRLDGPRATGSARRRGPLRVLVLDAGGPAADEELRALRQAALDAGAAGLRWAQALGLASIDSRVDPAGAAASLPRELAAFDADVLHVVAHGGWDKTRAEGSLLLNDGALGAQAFAALVTNATPAAVVLNTCLGARLPTDERQWSASSVAGALVRHGVPVVVAMQGLIEERAALTFAREFHARLLAGDSAPVATQHARLAVRAQDAAPDWALPTVYARADDEPPSRRPPASVRTQALALVLDGALAIAVTLLLAFLVPGGLDVVSARDAQWAAAGAGAGVGLAALWLAAAGFTARTRQAPRRARRLTSAAAGFALALLPLGRLWSARTVEPVRPPAAAAPTTSADGAADAYEPRRVPQPVALVLDDPLDCGADSAVTLELADVFALRDPGQALPELYAVALDWRWDPIGADRAYARARLGIEPTSNDVVIDTFPRSINAARPAGGALLVDRNKTFVPASSGADTLPYQPPTHAVSHKQESGDWRSWTVLRPSRDGRARLWLLLRPDAGAARTVLTVRRYVRVADVVFGRALDRCETSTLDALPLSLDPP